MLSKLKASQAFLDLPDEDKLHLLLNCDRNNTRTYAIIKRAFGNWHFAMVRASPGREQSRANAGVRISGGAATCEERVRSSGRGASESRGQGV